MPTARPGHLLTETDELARAIDAAAPLYPGESRADILGHLVQLGSAAIATRQDRRRQLVSDRAGRHSGVYPAGYLNELRDDWPE